MAFKIAYQGIEGSNSHAAAQKLALAAGLEQPEYIGLVTSFGVVDALSAGKANYGVMATYNIIAGEVAETKQACEHLRYTVIATQQMPVHHCLFALSDVSQGEIAAVASHVQALRQCKEYLGRQYADVQQLALEDTALGAKLLSQGSLAPTTAILCPKNAGEMYGLHLLAENVEDCKDNATTFILVKKEN